MDLIKRVKIFFIKRDFRKRVNINRQGMLISPTKMRSIGLLFCNNEGSDYQDYLPIYNVLKERGLTYEVLVSNYIPEFSPTHPKLKEHVIFMKDFPKDTVIKKTLFTDFIDNSFDMLIDLSDGGFENEYVVGLSNAKLKVGINKCSEKYYDIYIVPRNSDSPTQTINAIFDYLDKFTK